MDIIKELVGEDRSSLDKQNRINKALKDGVTKFV